MDLLDLLPILRRRWRVVALTIGVLVAAAVAFVATAPTRYEATAQIYVSTATTDDAVGLAQGSAFAIARVQSYVNLVDGLAVTAPVIDQLQLPYSPAELARRLSATAPAGKVLLEITAADASAERAASIANAVADRLVTYVPEVETASGNATPVRLTIIQPADVPSSPNAPPAVLLLVLALLGGLVAGGALAVARDALDTKVRSADDVTDLARPIVGTIPVDRGSSLHPVASDADAFGPRAEAYRRLRTTIAFVDVDRPPRTIAITSPRRGDGRTAVALNLAASLASAGHTVCLVEADLRNPALGALLHAADGPGLVAALIDHGTAPAFVAPGVPGLSVLLAGDVPPNPNELLSSDRARVLLAALAERFEYVVVDTSPLLDSSDGVEISSMVDATLLVARLDETRRPDLARSMASIELIGTKVAGLVLTMSKAPGQGYGRYAADGYRPSAGIDMSLAPTAPAE